MKNARKNRSFTRLTNDADKINSIRLSGSRISPKIVNAILKQSSETNYNNLIGGRIGQVNLVRYKMGVFISCDRSRKRYRRLLKMFTVKHN